MLSREQLPAPVSPSLCPTLCGNHIQAWALAPGSSKCPSFLHTGCLVVLSHLLGKGNSGWKKSYDSHSPRALSLRFTAMNVVRAAQVPGFWVNGACAEGRGTQEMER